MEEMNNQFPWAQEQPTPTGDPVIIAESAPESPVPPAHPVRTFFLTGKKELVFGFFVTLCCLMMANFTLFGGFSLGFSIAAVAYILCAAIYLLSTGCRLTLYSGLLLGLSLVISAGYARSDDGVVKFILVLFLFVSTNLGLCLMAGQQRRQEGSVSSLIDVTRTLFTMGYGQLPRAFRGLFRALRGKGSLGRKIGAILIGIVIMLPVVGLLIPLLTEADAAFAGLMEVLPEINVWEATVTVMFGVGMACIVYTRSVALRHRPKSAPVEFGIRKGLNALTINTVLCGVCLVYFLYLFSQLAYFVGGFAGILPEEFTMAQYARRGFFEMAWLCGINMTIIVLAVLLVRKPEGKAPLSTRVLCLFIGLVTVFMVAAASAKMAMYINSYGLTRARVATELAIIFLGIAALTVSVSLFLSKPRYMQVLVITALIMGAVTIWADMDTVIATYNVQSYLSGRLEEVDLDYLEDLSDGAVPQIALLVNDSDPDVAEKAQKIVDRRTSYWEDFREWNYADWLADQIAKNN